MRIRLDFLWLPRSGLHVAGIACGAAAIAATAVIVAWPVLAARPQPYPDLIAGVIAWTGYPKSSEYLAVACFFVAFALAWLPLTVAANRIPSRDWPSIWPTSEGLPLALVIGVGAYAGALGLLTRSWPWRALAAALLLLAVWTVLKRRSDDVEGAQKAAPRVFAAVVVSVVCGFFSIVGVFAALDALRPEWFLQPEASAAAAWTAVIPPLVGGALAVTIQRRIPVRGWQMVVSGSQILLPLLITVLAHDAYQHQGGVIRMNIPIATQWAIALTAVGGLAANIAARRRAESWTAVPSVDRLIRPASVVWIASFLMYRIPEASGLEWDYFHLGEYLLPWHQIVVHHQRVFTDFVPVQGGMSLLYGAVNSLFLAGTVSSIPIAASWLSVGAAAAAAWLVCRLVGPAWGLVLAPFFPIGFVALVPTDDRFFLALPILAALAHPRLLARPVRWLGWWAALSYLHVLYNVIIGLACTAASLPVAAWMARRGWADRAPSGGRLRLAAGLGLVVGVGAATAPLTLGLIRFVAEQGSANTTAYGIGALQAAGVPPWFWWHHNKTVWELVRIGGWMGGALALGSLLVYQAVRRRRAERSNQAGIVFALTALLFLLALTPYSMGQIRPDELSRPGTASMLAIGSLAPLALILTLGVAPKRVLMTAAILGALLGVRGPFSELDPWRVAQRAVTPILAPTRATWVSGFEVGLPNLGTIFIEPDTRDALRQLDATLRRVLRADERYLDLTDRSALYFILDRPVPVPYPDPYNAPTGPMQERLIRTLERKPPPLILLGVQSDRLMAPPSLRSYRLYRWLIERGYRFAELDGYSFLVRPDRGRELGLGMDEDANRDGLRRALAPADLGVLPLAWGRTLKGPVTRFEPRDVPLVPSAPDPAIAGGDPMRVWSIASPLRGADADFAAMQIRCDRPLTPPLAAQVYWASGSEAFSGDRSLGVGLAGGELLLPMGSHPDWLRSNGLTRFGIRLTADAGARCGVLRIGPPRFLRLVG